MESCTFWTSLTHLYANLLLIPLAGHVNSILERTLLCGTGPCGYFIDTFLLAGERANMQTDGSRVFCI